MLRKIEVERFSLTSSKPFEKVLAAISEAVGHPDMAEFWKSTHTAESVAELERAVKPVLGRTGLMQFVAFDHGAIIRKGTGRDAPRNVRLVIGNPLIMKEMAKHVPDAGSYAPGCGRSGQQSRNSLARSGSLNVRLGSDIRKINRRNSGGPDERKTCIPDRSKEGGLWRQVRCPGPLPRPYYPLPGHLVRQNHGRRNLRAAFAYLDVL